MTATEDCIGVSEDTQINPGPGLPADFWHSGATAAPGPRGTGPVRNVERITLCYAIVLPARKADLQPGSIIA